MRHVTFNGSVLSITTVSAREARTLYSQLSPLDEMTVRWRWQLAALALSCRCHRQLTLHAVATITRIRRRTQRGGGLRRFKYPPFHLKFLRFVCVWMCNAEMPRGIIILLLYLFVINIVHFKCTRMYMRKNYVENNLTRKKAEKKLPEQCQHYE